MITLASSYVHLPHVEYPDDKSSYCFSATVFLFILQQLSTRQKSLPVGRSSLGLWSVICINQITTVARLVRRWPIKPPKFIDKSINTSRHQSYPVVEVLTWWLAIVYESINPSMMQMLTPGRPMDAIVEIFFVSPVHLPHLTVSI